MEGNSNEKIIFLSHRDGPSLWNDPDQFGNRLRIHVSDSDVLNSVTVIVVVMVSCFTLKLDHTVCDGYGGRPDLWLMDEESPNLLII